MSDPRFTLATAKEAAETDSMAIWVGEFLASRGSDNAELAAALANRPHWWVGPVCLPIDRLEPLAGPDDDVLVPVEPEAWEGDVGEMASSLEEGWEPPPVLVEHQDGKLLLQDGNHRHEALRRAGATHVWAVIWCDDEAEGDRLAEDLAHLETPAPAASGRRPRRSRRH